MYIKFMPKLYVLLAKMIILVQTVFYMGVELVRPIKPGYLFKKNSCCKRQKNKGKRKKNKNKQHNFRLTLLSRKLPRPWSLSFFFAQNVQQNLTSPISTNMRADSKNRNNNMALSLPEKKKKKT